MSKKRIAIIGGGFSGLSSIRALKEENLEPVCFEKTPTSGGTWCYREDSPEGVPSIMPTTIINHSKEMGALSNCPPKREYANYMRHFETYQYFKDVGNAFDVFRHMIFNMDVINVRRSDDYDETGRWVVTVRNTETGETTCEVFDGVMVCVGHITYPKIYEFPGMEKFKGIIMHTHDLKGVDAFADKRICVVGIGCSAMDAAVETSNVAKQVYMSTRSGAWIIPRVGPQGMPMDAILLRRYITFFQEYFPINFCSMFIEFLLNQMFNHDLYNLRPNYHVLCKDPCINDQLPVKLLSGSIILKNNIKFFVENGVMFEGDDTITQVDVVIMATGYDWKYPFLEDGIVTTEIDGRINLYKCMWSPNLKHQTLTFIGFLLPFGPGFPLGEIQCRWFAQVISGKVKLPDKSEMMDDIRESFKRNVRRYRPGDKMSIRIDYVPYMDDIASKFGAKPNLLKLLFTDPVLFAACIFGPSLSYQYRLQGPHSWKGARQAILEAPKRMKTPLVAGRQRQKKKKNFNGAKQIMNFLIFFLWILWAVTFAVIYN